MFNLSTSAIELRGLNMASFTNKPKIELSYSTKGFVYSIGGILECPNGWSFKDSIVVSKSSLIVLYWLIGCSILFGPFEYISLQKEGSLACHTCFDKGLWFTRSHPYTGPRFVAVYDRPLLPRICSNVFNNLQMNENIFICNAKQQTNKPYTDSEIIYFSFT